MNDYRSQFQSLMNRFGRGNMETMPGYSGPRSGGFSLPGFRPGYGPPRMQPGMQPGPGYGGRQPGQPRPGDGFMPGFGVDPIVPGKGQPMPGFGTNPPAPPRATPTYTTMPIGRKGVF